MDLSERDGLRRLGVEDLRHVKRFLRMNAPFNAYLLGQVERGALGLEAIAGPFWGFVENGQLVGVICSGSNLVLSYPCSNGAIEAFAQAARRSVYLVRVAIAEDGILDRFMCHYGRDFRPIAVEREGQILFGVTGDSLVSHERKARLRPAEVAELEPVMETDRLMIAEELGFDPFRRDPKIYRDGWLRRIRELRVWVVGPELGPYLFKVEQSAISDDVVQLSGVYTAIDSRRQGIARDALGQMCRIILSDARRVSLYVHQANLPAVRLYRRLGFEELGSIRSVWFDV